MGNRNADDSLKNSGAMIRGEEDAERSVEALVAAFALDDAALRRVTDLLSAEMEKGLDARSHASADVKMFPTFVTAAPDGSEKGDFLAIDFGRSNFRILWVHLPANGERGTPTTQQQHPRVRSRIFVVSPPLMSGPGTDLFDFIAKCLASFMEKEDLLGRKLPLCFTFAFTLRQESLNRGRLVNWTKGFSCDGVVGEDVVALFHDALARVGVTHPGLQGVRCTAVINDATGTFMACAHTHADCCMGVIFGTGTNACYFESAAKIGTWTAETRDASAAGSPDAEKVIVNTNWGSFGENGCLDFLRTEFDKENDARSSKPGEGIFEKLIAGHYLGEIVRLALIKLHSLGIIFRDSTAFGPSLAPPYPNVNAAAGMSRSPSSVSLGAEERSMDDPDCDDGLPKFLHPERRRSFHTKYLTEVEGSDDLIVMKQVLGECGVRNASIRECEIVNKICKAISTRAAHLSAAGLVALLNRIPHSRVTVAVDGSLFKFHSRFHAQLKSKVNSLLAGRDVHVELVLANDGNGKGAALVAAVAQRLESAGLKEQEPMQL